MIQPALHEQFWLLRVAGTSSLHTFGPLVTTEHYLNTTALLSIVVPLL